MISDTSDSEPAHEGGELALATRRKQSKRFVAGALVVTASYALIGALNVALGLRRLGELWVFAISGTLIVAPMLLFAYLLRRPPRRPVAPSFQIRPPSPTERRLFTAAGVALGIVLATVAFLRTILSVSIPPIVLVAFGASFMVAGIIKEVRATIPVIRRLRDRLLQEHGVTQATTPEQRETVRRTMEEEFQRRSPYVGMMLLAAGAVILGLGLVR